MSGKKGFTLIELLVVIIIVGILAAVAIPMMRGNVMRAKASEAIAGLGSIRSQMRAEYAEHGRYDISVNSGAVVGNVPGFSTGDLDGRYFSDDDYTITTEGGVPGFFTATATGFTGGTSGDNMSGVTITIDQDGDIGETYP